MSRGIGGSLRKVLENKELIVYEYYSYNLNKTEHRNDQKIFDGKITIDKMNFLEIAFEDMNLESLLSKKIITIKNSSNCFAQSIEGYELIALSLINKVLKRYKDVKEFPETLSYDV